MIPADTLHRLGLPVTAALLLGSCSVAPNASPAPVGPASALEGGDEAPAESSTFRTSDGRIVVRPRLKYELAISLHVLRFAEDHHPSFIPWAESMRASLSARTLREATTLIEHTHEWGLADAMADYDGGDDIAGIETFIRADRDAKLASWAEGQTALLDALGLEASAFPTWYASFLRRYHDEGFAAAWRAEHGPLVREDAARTVERLEAEPNPLEALEALTGRKLEGPGEVVLYPSSFSRPNHGYGFTEQGRPVALYKVGGEVIEVLGTVYHELLHPLVRGWTDQPRLRPHVERLAASAAFRRDWEQGAQGNYAFPDNWLDELFVHSLSRYFVHRQGYLPRDWVPTNSYGAYEDALYDAILAHYEHAGTFDAFAEHALQTIVETGDPEQPFAYRP